MNCKMSDSGLHGYIDGELDAVRSEEFERHLESCAECRATLGTHQALRAKLREAGLREAAPARLHLSVAKSLSMARPKARFWIGPRVRWMAAAAAVLFVCFLSWRALVPFEGQSSPGVGIEAVLDAHLRSLQPGHLTDVASTDQHTVKPWFDGRVNYAPPVADLSSAGYPLIGGRLDVLDGRTVVALVYGRRKHSINVFVWPGDRADREPESGSASGYGWVRWAKGGMEYCAISDTSMTDLRELADLLSR